MEDKYRWILLMDENKEKCLEIGFFGYTDEMINDYISRTYVESGKPYCSKWAELKEIYCK